MRSARHLPIAAAVLMVGSTIACQAPGSVDGVFGGAEFSLRCERPLATSDASGRDKVVVLSQADPETLRTVNLRLRGVADLTLGKAQAIGTDEEGLPSVQVVVGDLVVDTRADGVEVLSPADPTRASSVTGTLTLQSRTADSVAGSFRADLDDGGYVEGFFDAAMTQ
jgi:hypothetical protein